MGVDHLKEFDKYITQNYTEWDSKAFAWLRIRKRTDTVYKGWIHPELLRETSTTALHDTIIECRNAIRRNGFNGSNYGSYLNTSLKHEINRQFPKMLKANKNKSVRSIRELMEMDDYELDHIPPDNRRFNEAIVQDPDAFNRMDTFDDLFRESVNEFIDRYPFRKFMPVAKMLLWKGHSLRSVSEDFGIGRSVVKQWEAHLRELLAEWWYDTDNAEMVQRRYERQHYAE